MSRVLAHIALVVEDYDKAIDFYTNKLGFSLIEDKELPDEQKTLGGGNTGRVWHISIIS